MKRVAFTDSLRDFVWLNGKSVENTYQNFAPGEPNNNLGEENCGVFHTRIGFWRSEDCVTPRFYVCQREEDFSSECTSLATETSLIIFITIIVVFVLCLCIIVILGVCLCRTRSKLREFSDRNCKNTIQKTQSSFVNKSDDCHSKIEATPEVYVELESEQQDASPYEQISSKPVALMPNEKLNQQPFTNSHLENQAHHYVNEAVISTHYNNNLK